MSTSSELPRASRRNARLRRWASPSSVWSEPVWTIRSAVPARGAGADPAKSAGSNPIGTASTIRSASSGMARRKRAAASGAQVTIAVADASARRMRAKSTWRCSAVGCTRISSSAQGSSRSAIQGRPSACERRAPASAVSYGTQDARIRSLPAPSSKPSRTALSTHQRTQGAGRWSQRSARARRPVCPAGSSPGTRCISASAGRPASRPGSRGLQRSTPTAGPGHHDGPVAGAGRCLT